MTEQSISFEQECRQAVDQLRAALVGLFDSVDADPLSPQDVARRFGLNKTLTWNLSRLIHSPGDLAAITHVPGRAAVEKLLKATRQRGASLESVASVREAVDEFDRVIELHVGDRTTLDLVLDGLGTHRSEQLERSRKLAFRGNSGLYGVQARTKLVTGFLAPNSDDPDRLDMAMIAGHTGFRRLRASVRWPVFKPRFYSLDENEKEFTSAAWQPIDPSPEDAPRLSLMHGFCKGVPQVEVVAARDGVDIMLKTGPIGNPGAFDCYRGDFMRSAVGRYRSESDLTGDFGASITTPVEYLVADLIAHEELAFALTPEVLVYSRFFPEGEAPDARDDHLRLPISQSVVELPGRPPAVATSLVPRYAEMVNRVYERLEWDPSRFRAVRLQMAYPPFGSTVLLRFALPEGP